MMCSVFSSVVLVLLGLHVSVVLGKKCSRGESYNKGLRRCVDIDECKGSPCTQKCHNTHGSFYCTCSSGYKLIRGFKCEDINECTTTRPCSQKCVNYKGTYACSCNTGHRIDQNDRHKCIQLKCGVLSTPNNGIIRPPCQANVPYPYIKNAAWNVNRATKIVVAKQITETQKTCTSAIRWQGADINCEKMDCPILTNPANGNVVCPRNAHKFDSGVCRLSCHTGYNRVGPATTKCQIDTRQNVKRKPVIWRHLITGGTRCVKDPTISCPADFTGKLLSGTKLAVNIQQPTSNMPNSKIKIIPAHLKIGKASSFDVGVKTVIFTAHNEQFSKQCSWKITVKDAVAPINTHCPSDITLKGTSSKKSADKPITWDVPQFKDNIGLKSTEVSFQLPKDPSSSVYQFLHKASDDAGNVATCKFSVIENRTTSCPPLKQGDGSFLKCKSWPIGTFCTTDCIQKETASYSSFEKPEVVYMCGQDGNWSPKKYTPDCSESIIKDEFTNTCDGNWEAGSVEIARRGLKMCVLCPTGTFRFKEKKLGAIETCKKCKKDTYQNKEGSTKCTPCGSDKVTLTEGAKSQSECIATCLKGTYSPTGRPAPGKKCSKCPINQYADVIGSKTCTPCPSGTSTSTTGADSKNKCTAPPSFVRATSALNGTSATVFGTITLDCRASGSPTPNVTWTKYTGGKFMALKKDFIQKTKVYKDGTIKIELVNFNAGSSDTGTYACTAENSSGSKSIFVKITVEEFRRRRRQVSQ